MTNGTTGQQAQPRGAGSGEKANATRSRNIVDWPPQPEAHADAVEKLDAERDAQAFYNDEMNKLQTEQVAALKDKIGFPQGEPATPEEQRKAAMDAFVNATDPKKKEAALKGEMEARAKRDKAQAAAMTGQR